MKRKRTLHAALLMAALTAPGAHAGAVRHVDGDAAPGGDGLTWATAYQSLDSALVEAANGEVAEIWVAEGVYRPSIRSNPLQPRSERFVLRAATALYGGFAGDERSLDHRDPTRHVTVLSGDLNQDDGPSFANRGDNAFHVLVATGLAQVATLDGFLVRGGTAPFGSHEVDGNGGGLKAQNSAVLVRGCRFEDNQSNGFGGGMHAQGGDVVVQACSFVGNQAGEAGAAASAGTYNSQVPTAFTITDSVFEQNHAGSGGAVNTVFSVAATISGCAFVANSAANGGGAIRIGDDGVAISDCTFVLNVAVDGAAIFTSAAPPYGAGATWIDGCVFDTNIADSRGGAVFAMAETGFARSLVIERSVLRFNFALSQGGAIFTNQATTTVRSTAVTGNWAPTGGGVLVQGGVALAENATLYGNEAAAAGGGFRVAAGSLKVASSIVWANTDGGDDVLAAQCSDGPGASFAPSFSCIQGLPATTGEPWNIAADPLLVDAAGADGRFGTEDDDLRPSAASPCVNRGDPFSAIAPGALDALGAPRVQVCRVDMGAIESDYAAAAIIDCDANGVADECDLALGDAFDCDHTTTLDACDIASGRAGDCDGDGVPDSCQVDCDGDGTPDPCEIAAGEAIDCDGNGVDDLCELAPIEFDAAFGPVAPFGAGAPAVFTLLDPPTPIGPVVLVVSAVADLGATNESVAIKINATNIGTIFAGGVGGGSDCPLIADVATVSIAAQAFLAATGGGDATFTFTASTQVSPDQCVLNALKVTLSYPVSPPTDADGDGVVDACAAVGDFDGDGDVDGGDLGVLLALWGACPGGSMCVADLNDDGIVDGADLGALLANWN